MLRSAQDPTRSASEHNQALRHIALAQAYLLPQGHAGLVLTHGVSGSGKSHYARQLAARSGFIHLRSDIERRRLAGLALDARSGSAPHAGLYEASMTTATYARLLTLAGEVLRAGYSVVVDATFLKADDRAPFIALAAACDAPVHILCCAAPADELRRRVATRAALGEDVSEATVEVLERQLLRASALMPHEQRLRVTTEVIEGGDTSLAALGRPRAHL
jgi:predicted kinase